MCSVGTLPSTRISMTYYARAAVYWAFVVVQFAVIIGFMLHSREQDRQLTLLHNEAGDWEQISETWKRSAATYAMSSERCLATVRDYQRMVFQPVEMSK